MGDAARLSHVLVINAIQEDLDLMRDLLAEGGYQVSASLETPDLPRIKALAPDVIVQELLFAGSAREAGWKFLTLARLDPAVARIPLVLCTAAVETVTAPDMAQNLDRLGVRVLLKPFNLDDLLTAVAEALTAQKLIDQVRQRDPVSEV
jgi:CheY-like chemotaxis protein